MTKELRHTLCDHAAGNYRICIGMAAEVAHDRAQREITVLDEKLYLQVFAHRKLKVRAALPVHADMHEDADRFAFPDLPEEAVVALDQFLEDFYHHFQNHYFAQLHQHYTKYTNGSTTTIPCPCRRSTIHRSDRLELTAVTAPRSRSSMVHQIS